VAIVDLLTSLLYPPRCAACGRDLVRATRSGLCRRCRAQLIDVGAACVRCGEPGALGTCIVCRRDPPPFARARACFLYDDGAASRLVLRWKNGGDHLIGSSLCRLLAEHRQRHLECYDLVVPVPLHSSRLHARGFNQAALLARAAALPGEWLAVDVVRRSEATARQATLGRAARAGNVQDAFVARASRALRDRRVLLVDDVVTTGATVRACARALLDAGARNVDVLSFARTPRPALRASLGRAVADAAPGAAR
jgi:ComF family protein